MYTIAVSFIHESQYSSGTQLINSSTEKNVEEQLLNTNQH